MKKAVWEYISKNSGEDIYTWQTCMYSGEQFPVFEKEKHILDELDMPLPNTSPEMRLRNTYIMRNEYHLYKRKCDLTGQKMLTVYPQEYQGEVYHFSKYGSDDWSAFDYGKEIDFTSDISLQINDFFDSVPRRSLNISTERDMENCDYSNYGIASKDCYMCQVPVYAEKCYYSHTPYQSVYNFDSYLNEKCEISYESIYCINSYQVFYCEYVEDSRDCWFGYDLTGCKNCIGCVGLDGKQYFIFNQSVSQEEYSAKLKEIFSSYQSVEDFKKQFEDFASNIPRKYLQNKLSENTYGNIVRYSKAIINCFTIVDSQDIFHTTHTGLKSSYLVSCDNCGPNSSYLFHCIGSSASHKSAFLSYGGSSTSYYMHDCRDCNDCMFCVGLSNQQYCIFNIQYSKSEYEKLSKKLIDILKQQDIWGNGYPFGMHLYPYNDTKANTYFPVEKVVYLDGDKNPIRVEKKDENGRGIVYVFELDKYISKAKIDFGGKQQMDILWRTQENNTNIPQDAIILSSENIPDIIEIGDDIINQIILCEETGKPFRIIAQELEFYKKYSLPIPRKHPDTRFKNRFKKLPRNTLYLKTCSECDVKTLTCWNDKDVVCEKCYSNNMN